ncbi:RDD family protein [Campylobacter sp. JMF_02 ED1]|uniref:RDD family protein n=1 Tax=unclassified Campylobacter TaxID=2593542 RepID=UPI0022EA037F|nr:MULTISPECIES: RDD family protein [unclassified Campylobacter]MDA3047903.1 RDD family protein [Campylobacter sp. JMF_08 NE1]MDA3049849.1 RDD family protein [Campylobacter sp. JMF_15 NE4]MDA3050807.1 RDD family protein [Campylobacter sp. JMF_02 ED1]
MLASLPKRIFAFILDEVIMGVLFTFMLISVASEPMLAALQMSGSDPMALNNAIAPYLPYLVMVKFLYHAIFVYFYGATLGKLALKIKVISARDENERLSFGVCAFRSGVRLVSETAFYIGFLFAFWTKFRQSLQDLAAKTLVVEIEKK